MAKKSTVIPNWLQTTAVRVTRVHFLFIAIYMASIIVFDSWNLFTHAAIADRWTAAGILLVITTVLWYVSRIKFSKDAVYIISILALVVADIVFAAFNVLWEQGLASKAVALFALPIVAAATLRSRSALLATASLSAATYSVVAVRYFNQHYGEGYRVELYGTVGFYCALFFILAGLLLVIIRPSQQGRF